MIATETINSRTRPLLLLAVAACLAAAACLAGCTRDDEAAPPATRPASEPVVLTLGGQPIRVEVAATEASRELGLMYRKSLPPDAGMVFVFPREQELRFWMKDTEIPLDIVYLDRGGRIVSIKPLVPFDTEGVPSGGPAKYAIELNRGTAAKLGLKPGDVIALPDRVRNPPELE